MDGNHTTNIRFQLWRVQWRLSAVPSKLNREIHYLMFGNNTTVTCTERKHRKRAIWNGMKMLDYGHGWTENCCLQYWEYWYTFILRTYDSHAKSFYRFWYGKYSALMSWSKRISRPKWPKEDGRSTPGDKRMNPTGWCNRARKHGVSRVITKGALKFIPFYGAQKGLKCIPFNQVQSPKNAYVTSGSRIWV